MRYDSDQPLYVFHWKHERKGQQCRVIRKGKRTVEVRFADGYQMIVNRAAIRRDDVMNDLDLKQQQPQKNPPPDPPDPEPKEEEEEGEEQEQEQVQEQPKTEPKHGQTH